MKSWFVQFLAPVITRHLTQFICGLLFGMAAFKGHETDVQSLVLAAVSAVVGLAVMAWGGKKVTPSDILTDAVNLPQVDKEQTVITVTDPTVAAKTPTEVVLGQDMSIQ